MTQMLLRKLQAQGNPFPSFDSFFFWGVLILSPLSNSVRLCLNRVESGCSEIYEAWRCSELFVFSKGLRVKKLEVEAWQGNLGFVFFCCFFCQISHCHILFSSHLRDYRRVCWRNSEGFFEPADVCCLILLLWWTMSGIKSTTHMRFDVRCFEGAKKKKKRFLCITNNNQYLHICYLLRNSNKKKRSGVQ